VRKLLVVSVLLATALPLLAQTQTGGAAAGVETVNTARRAKPPTGPVPRLPNGQVDLNGVWVGGGPINDLEKDGGLKPGEIDSLMLPWAKELMSKRDVTLEPHNQCLPMGVPRVTPFPYRFLQNYTDKAPTHLFILHEGNIHTYRQIFMDGRKHPAELDPTWFGHSIGWYEGDTLVIDTVGFNETFWLDRRGLPHTNQMHVTERFTRTDQATIKYETLVDDPGAYTEPWKGGFNLRWEAGTELFEYVCQQANYATELMVGDYGKVDRTSDIIP